MKFNTKGQFGLIFSFLSIKNNKRKTFASLLVSLIGIFLLPKIAYMTSIEAETLINLTNKEREIVSLNKLTPNQLLNKAAENKASDILKSQTFQHTIDEKKFSAWIKESEYKYISAGENLAIDFLTSEGIIKAWMNSDLHRKNILNNRFGEIGVAAIEGKFKGEKTIIVVEIFGEPLNILETEKNNNYSELTTAQIKTLEKKLNLNTIISENKNILLPSNYIALNSKTFLSNQPNLFLNNQNADPLIDEYSEIIMYITLMIISIFLIFYFSFYCAFRIYLKASKEKDRQNGFFDFKKYKSFLYYIFFSPKKAMK